MGLLADPSKIELAQESSPFDPADTSINHHQQPAFQCDRCTYIWTPRTDKPKQCPNCYAKIDYSDSDPGPQSGIIEMMNDYIEGCEPNVAEYDRGDSSTQIESEDETDTEGDSEDKPWEP